MLHLPKALWEWGVFKVLTLKRAFKIVDWNQIEDLTETLDENHPNFIFQRSFQNHIHKLQKPDLITSGSSPSVVTSVKAILPLPRDSPTVASYSTLKDTSIRCRRLPRETEMEQSPFKSATPTATEARNWSKKMDEIRMFCCDSSMSLLMYQNCMSSLFLGGNK